MRMRSASVILGVLVTSLALVLLRSSFGTRAKARYLISNFQTAPKRDPGSEALELASLGQRAIPVLFEKILLPDGHHVDVGIVLALIRQRDALLPSRMSEFINASDSELRGSAISALTATRYYSGFTPEEENIFDTPIIIDQLAKISESDPVAHNRQMAREAIRCIEESRGKKS